MRSSIDRDLRKTEHRESQLWFLRLGLLLSFGGVIVAIFLGEADSHPWTSRPSTTWGFFFLIALFCLYVVHALLLNGRMKSLLVQTSSLAASSIELDNFLPSIAHKIAKTTSVTLCQIALLAHSRSTLTIKSSHANVNQQPEVGKTYPLEKLSVCRQAVETLQPVVLHRRDIAQLPVGRDDHELLTGGLKDIHSLLIVPMVTKERILGIIILGEAKGFIKRRFTASTVAIAQAFARHAATAIDQARLKREAIHDPLTNLYNRRHFRERLKEEISRTDRNKHITAILLCDLDRFRAINDTHGHQFGDDVLKVVAKRIQESTRGTDLVFRWGGDEIAVILSNSSREAALIVAGRIREGVRKTGETAQVDIDVSIGVALYPEHGRNEDELIRIADRALYIAKKSDGKLHVGEEGYQLNRHSIKVVFEPVVDISSEQVLGYEALTRDAQGKLSAFEFFEKYRAIGRLNELKQLTFTSQLKVAQEHGLERVFINADFEVLSQLDPISKPSGMDVVIELSELEALRDLENHLAVAQRWREKGYEFAIDDFGAGFISFPFLAMLVPEYIKVDRSTMLQAVSSEKFKGFLKSLLHAVRTYATAGIIVEGVENEKELQVVKELGIFLVQGFLFGKQQELKGPTAMVAPDALQVRAIKLK
ncbi:MAG: diguanylate cyclase [Deltaproteobacteria bacterium]|nr:diguanylate cyclase [Deltaproteobacteria bacterium]